MLLSVNRFPKTKSVISACVILVACVKMFMVWFFMYDFYRGNSRDSMPFFEEKLTGNTDVKVNVMAITEIKIKVPKQMRAYIRPETNTD